MRVHRRSRGFTLVELLVVIGIIAILIGILLPSLSKARGAANAMKCQTALRQIGMGFQLYYNDFNQYVPPALLTCAGNTYSVGDDVMPIVSGAARVYWYNFIAPEVNAANMGYATAIGGAAAQARKRNVLWGCPSFTGYVKYTIAAGDDINRLQPGYGMSGWLLYQGDSDLTYDPIGGPQPYQETGKDQNILSMDASMKLAPGTHWYKVSEVRDSANRGLVADSRFWLWESVNPGPGPNFPQNIAQQNASGASYTMTGPAQTTCDIFRHGKEPGASGSGSSSVFAADGGSVRYNVLYFDGHVDSQSTAPEAYRAQRMRFPN